MIAEHFAGTHARVVGDGRRTLVVRGMSFATVGPDPAMITPVCAVSARDLPVVDVLAALASQDPSGVLVIETAEEAFAFEVSGGRLTGARGVGPLDQLETFVAEVHRRHPQRFGTDEEIGCDQPAWMKVARNFVEERVLDQLTLGRIPGTRMTLFRGDVEWLGTRLPADVGPTLGHVLLEHARRFDELPKLLETLGDLDRLAVPLAEPGDRPVDRAPADSARDWDFFTDPDPAALAEWNDAIAVWSLCDGESSLREIVDAVMLGHFRGLLALRTLASARCIVLIDPPRKTRRVTEPPTYFEAPHGDVIPLRTPSEPVPAPVPSTTGYSIVSHRTSNRGQRTRVEVAAAQPHRMTPAYGTRLKRPAGATGPSSHAPSAPTVPVAGPQVGVQAPIVADASVSTRSGTIEVDISSAEMPIPRAARSLAAARALDGALPSPTTVMIVLGATGVLALVASLAALV